MLEDYATKSSPVPLFGVRGHVRALVRRDVSRRGKAATGSPHSTANWDTTAPRAVSQFPARGIYAASSAKENSPKASRIEPLNLSMPHELPNINAARLLFPLRSHSDGRGEGQGEVWAPSLEFDVRCSMFPGSWRASFRFFACIGTMNRRRNGARLCEPQHVALQTKLLRVTDPRSEIRFMERAGVRGPFSVFFIRCSTFDVRCSPLHAAPSPGVRATDKNLRFLRRHRVYKLASDGL